MKKTSLFDDQFKQGRKFAAMAALPINATCYLKGNYEIGIPVSLGQDRKHVSLLVTVA